MNKLILTSLLLNCASIAFGETDSKSTSTSAFPVLTLTPRSGLVFDYHVALGSPPQTMGLRLDILNGELWVPDSNGYKACGSTYNISSTELVEYTATITGDSASASSTSTNTKTSTKKTSSTSSSSSSSSSSSPSSSIITSYSSSLNSSATSTSTTSYCASDGIYTLSDSSSGEYYNIDTGLSSSDPADASEVEQFFLDYIYLEGHYATDNFSIPIRSANDVLELDDVIFRSVNSSDVSLGAFAVGLSEDGLPTILDRMVDEGVIGSNGYSLNLASDNAQLLLGGVSSNRFTDDNLVEFDFIPVEDLTAEVVTSGYTNNYPVIPLSGFGVTSDSTGKSAQFDNNYYDEISSGSYPRPAILDSRNYYNYIPYSTLIDIAVELNAYYAESLNRWLVACDVGSSGTLDIRLANITVHIPISDILFEAYDKTTDSRLYFSSGGYACFVGLLPDYYFGFSILGTSFLKNVYLAVDNEGKKLALGTPANLTEVLEDYDLEDEDIEPISSGYIPYALGNNITSYSDLTLTIQSNSVSLSSSLSRQIASVSNGEVFVGDSLTATASMTKTGSMLSASGSFTSTQKAGADGLFGDLSMNILDSKRSSFTVLIYSSLAIFGLINML